MKSEIEEKRLEMVAYRKTLSPIEQENFDKQFGDILYKEITKEINDCKRRGAVKVENGITTYGD